MAGLVCVALWRSREERPMLARGVALALAVTLGLSVLGIVAGRTPPPEAAVGNLLGGLALAALFAWALRELREPAAQAAGFVVVCGVLLLAAQCLLGALLSISAPAAASPTLPVHAMVGIVLASGAAWLALRVAQARRRRAGFVLAMLVPAAGFTALHYETSAGAAFAHAAVAVLLVVAAAYTRLRPA